MTSSCFIINLKNPDVVKLELCVFLVIINSYHLVVSLLPAYSVMIVKA